MTLFNKKAPWIMSKLMADLGLGFDDAAAIVGNLGHESAGFKALQEIEPTVKGSRGGYGWAQWTGPRRRLYEAYCKRNNLNPASDEANYAFLYVELTGTHKAAIPALRAARSLRDKVVAFEKKYERAGVKHYDSRYAYAKRALAVYKPMVPPPSAVPPAPPPEADPRDVGLAASGAAATAATGAYFGWEWLLAAAVVLIVLGAAWHYREHIRSWVGGLIEKWRA